MKINISKNKRTIEIPVSATKEELIEILCKWAPLIALDNDKTKYSLVSVLGNDTSDTQHTKEPNAGKSAPFNDPMEYLSNMFGFDKYKK